MKFILLTALLSISSLCFGATKQVDVIYGEDNRKDVYEVSSPLHVQLSQSVAGMVSGDSIKPISGTSQTRIVGSSLVSRGICKKEKFSDQISAANCSGFLISDEYVATAGHCIRSEADCAEYSWVFDYSLKAKNQKEIIVNNSSVYKCKEVIKTVLDSGSMNDFAVVRLERKVKDRAPLKFRDTGKPQVNDPLVVIGCPTGLPLKIADGANVRILKDKFFSANLDTYGGNSGSPVFNSETGIVEGILVRGESDYVRDPSGCMVSNVCSSNGCRGEDVTYSSALADLSKAIRIKKEKK